MVAVWTWLLDMMMKTKEKLWTICWHAGLYLAIVQAYKVSEVVSLAVTASGMRFDLLRRI